MMHLNRKGTGLALLMLLSAPCAASAEMSAATTTSPAAASSLVPAGFDVPRLVEAGEFKLVPLGPELVKIDFDAYMSSIEHLQKTFTRGPEWPHSGISDADAMRDMETEQARFRKRASFAYSVLTKDGRRERGCVYVYPSPVAGYDAVVRLWVTKAEYDAGFDAELLRWVTTWIKRDWPFAKVAYPGRTIDWDQWESAVAASKKRNPATP